MSVASQDEPNFWNMSQFFPEGMICAQIAFFSFWMGLPPKPQQPIKVHQPTKDFFDIFRRPFFVKKLFFSLTQISYLGVKSLGHWRLKVTVTQQNRFSTGLWLLRHFFRILNLTKWPIFHQTIWVDFLIFSSIFEIFSFWDFWRFSDAACSTFIFLNNDSDRWFLDGNFEKSAIIFPKVAR